MATRFAVEVEKKRARDHGVRPFIQSEFVKPAPTHSAARTTSWERKESLVPLTSIVVVPTPLYVWKRSAGS